MGRFFIVHDSPKKSAIGRFFLVHNNPLADFLHNTHMFNETSIRGGFLRVVVEPIEQIRAVDFR